MSLNSIKIRSTTQNSIVTSSTSSKMTIAQYREEEEPLLESQMNSGPRRIALFIEPSPFSYVSGYKNRFQNFIKYLREMGDEVMVITTDEGVPQEFYGALLIGSRRYLDLMKECLGSFPCPYYGKVPLSLAFSPRIISAVAKFKPHIVHASSPGIMVFGALATAKLLSIPIVMSYHTHIPLYIPRYTFSWLVKPMWLILKFLHRAADLTLVPSAAIGRDLEAAEVTSANKIRLWKKGVDSESFHPRFFSEEMRLRLSNGESNKPLIVHVGRLGVEKSLDFLKGVMDREELEQMFSGMPAVFTGTLQGDELSQAYASGDVFIMPSESETLGLVVLEAMSSGLPVVAARAGGIPDIIPNDQQGKTGYLFNPGDHDDCLSKLEPLLYDRELRENIGKAARAEMEKYDWRASTREIRNRQYSDAIRFWREGRDEFLRPFRLLFQRVNFHAPAVEM
ncbi:Sulfoquinovosyl transferase sqd2 [Orobanche hederae]